MGIRPIGDHRPAKEVELKAMDTWVDRFLAAAKRELEVTAPRDSGNLASSFRIEGRGRNARLVNDSGYMVYLTNLRDGRTADDWITQALQRAEQQVRG